jgi:hypothetical protein
MCPGDLGSRDRVKSNRRAEQRGPHHAHLHPCLTPEKSLLSYSFMARHDTVIRDLSKHAQVVSFYMLQRSLQS